VDEQGPRAALGDLADSFAQFAAHLEADPIAARANETEDGQGPAERKLGERHGHRWALNQSMAAARRAVSSPMPELPPTATRVCPVRALT
jgi:hypothetical protein